jgi:aspartate racemase
VHIGLIGGIGPAATEFYYRGLVKGHALAGKPLEVTIVHADARELVSNLALGAAKAQAEIFLKYIRRLQSAGADSAVVTSLGGHFCMDELEEISPLPIINAIPILDSFFRENRIARIGILGTRTVMESRLYGGISSAEILLPQGDDLEATHNNYITMATSGQATDQQRDFFLSLGEKICRDQKADAIALAGTDLFLVFDGRDCGYPVVDCAQIHIDSLVSLSTGVDCPV